MNYSLLANVKKAFTGESQDLVDPYVEVSFAGMTVRRLYMFPYLGFLPTFGPTYVHLYGSTRDYSLIDQHSSLNDGMGEGVSYRGRILISIRTEIMDILEYPQSTEVEVECLPPITDSALGKNEDFFLFCSIFEATMIDKRLTDKPLAFELSIGNSGNSLDGNMEAVKKPKDYFIDDIDDLKVDTGFWQSTTLSCKAASVDKLYYYLPIWDHKQCMQIRSIWPDHRRRMYNSNLIANIIEMFEEGLADSEISLNNENYDSSVLILKSTLEAASNACTSYVRHMTSAPPLGNTKLDRERQKLCLHELWPGKKASSPSGWAIPAKICVYFWLGVVQHKAHYIDGLPPGYEVTNELKNAGLRQSNAPQTIFYAEKHKFQMRAYIYQARSLIGSDASGLSDPFARIIIGDLSQTTQVIDQTLSPTWDETLVFENITLYSTIENIKADPPTVVIEIFDQDSVGKSEFIGRTLVKPFIKSLEDIRDRPPCLPALEWHDIRRGDDMAGELLATFELLELVDAEDTKELPDLPSPRLPTGKPPLELLNQGPILPVPRGIRPTLSKYRIEVLFWGLRDLKRVHFLTVDKPRVDIECSGHTLTSTVIQNAKRNPNFNNPTKFIELELPDQDVYQPPLTIRVVDCRSFGRNVLVGTHTINSIQKYIFTPMSKRERDMEDRKKSLIQLQNVDLRANCIIQEDVFTIGHERENMPLLPRGTPITYGSKQDRSPTRTRSLERGTRGSRGSRKRKTSADSTTNEDDGVGSKDWWTKYFASYDVMLEEMKEKNTKGYSLQPAQVNSSGGISPRSTRDEIISPARCDREYGGARRKIPQSPKGKSQPCTSSSTMVTTKKNQIPKSALTKAYPHELEAVPEYEEFKEWLHTFDLYRGKKTGDDSDDESRVVGAFKGAIKVYKWPLPRGIDDSTIMGHDPNYGFFQGVPNNEPIHVLVRIYIVKATDLHPMDMNGKADPYIVLYLGNKKIADKDHYVSKQLNPVFGKCYEIEATFPQDSNLTIAVYDWDLILAKLCKDGKLEPPVYEQTRVKVGRTVFNMPLNDTELFSNPDNYEEQMALVVLRRWQEVPRVGCHLVTEHVETRSLYNPSKPGIEQGRLELWVDMFPMDMPAPGPPLDISPRKPKSYEMRVIIWNTDDVVLEDDAFFTGEKMSDIYVKGWVKGPDDCQSTDIHYRSLTGEGNFNWRFVYPFEYLEAEERIVTSRKESVFSWDETECKIPARLELQVWDADHFSADDFLGALTLDLNRFPRGAKSAKLCTLEMLCSDGAVPTINIFKQKRVRGWWPFYIKRDTEEMELTGKVEAEIHLLTREEADKLPAGLGRSEPDPLEKPK
ncbi:Otoferlin [Operophtera brumata]|uniref:Otoferlin n=1 Tax=Operophtera brumata TaxID=104452 RepID=A0A0L7KW39_OPEBR|nr:Otoferlin [Operophtera brumata]